MEVSEATEVTRKISLPPHPRPHGTLPPNPYGIVPPGLPTVCGILFKPILGSQRITTTDIWITQYMVPEIEGSSSAYSAIYLTSSLLLEI